MFLIRQLKSVESVGKTFRLKKNVKMTAVNENKNTQAFY